ncbi:MAG: ATP-binding protein [Thermoplasmatota archaeon]
MKIHLPNSAFLGNIDPFLRSFDDSDPSSLELSANKNWISIHPVVLSMIASLAKEIGTENIRPMSFEARSMHYLQRMGMFEILGFPKRIDIQEHDPSGRFIPLTNIRTTDELSNFIKDMVPLLHLDPRHARPIKFIISELVRNVLEHSGSDDGGFVCAQYYKKSNIIRIGIADRGVGIKDTICRSYLVKDDLEAIKLALSPGITGTTRREGGTEINAGAGLFFIKSIATVNRDFLMIYSGNAMYKLLKASRGRKRIKINEDPDKDRHSSGSDYPYWKGTVVGIDINLDQTSEFTDVLDLVRITFVRAIKERKKKRYRRPRFI